VLAVAPIVTKDEASSLLPISVVYFHRCDHHAQAEGMLLPHGGDGGPSSTQGRRAGA